MPRIRFNDRALAVLKPSPGKQADYWDIGMPGFGMRVSPGGGKAFTFMYEYFGEKRRLTLGRYPRLSLADAREQAQAIAGNVVRGIDPRAEAMAEKAAVTFAELADRYIELHAKPRKRSWKKDDYIIKRDLLPKFGGRKARLITRREVIAMLDRIVSRGSPVQANRTLAIMRKIYNWGMSRDLVKTNPCHGIERPAKERERDRVLSDREIRILWHGVDTGPMLAGTALALKLQLVVAQRKGEVAGAAWSEFDLPARVWTIPNERAKSGLSHRVPLSPLALDLLLSIRNLNGKSKWLFPARHGDGPISASALDHALRRGTSATRPVPKGKRRIELDDVVPHDSRRTAGSIMASLGVPRLVISKVLSHAEAGVTKIYDRHSYDDEKRSALETWGSHLESILSIDRTANATVLQMPHGGSTGA